MRAKVIAKGIMEQIKTIPIYTKTFEETLLQELKEIKRNESKVTEEIAL